MTTAATQRAGLPDGALVRVAAAGTAWATQLPALPEGYRVTVSVGHTDSTDEIRRTLAERGYELAHAGPVAGARGLVADLFVPEELVRVHPSWWRQLAAGAQRAARPTHGPVADRLAQVIHVHARAWATPTG